MGHFYDTGQDCNNRLDCSHSTSPLGIDDYLQLFVPHVVQFTCSHDTVSGNGTPVVAGDPIYRRPVRLAYLPGHLSIYRR